MEGMHLVVDHETHAVLAIPKTESVAASVSAGILNTFTTNIPSELTLVKARILKNVDLANDSLQLTYDRDENDKIIYLQKLPENLQTEEYARKRSLAKLRATYIYYQESYYRHYLARSIIAPSFRGMFPSICYEILNSNDEEGNYSAGLLEYAEILNLTPQEAFHELKLMTESSSIINMKYLAWYRKNVDAINTLHTEAEMREYSTSTWAKLLEASVL